MKMTSICAKEEWDYKFTTHASSKTTRSISDAITDFIVFCSNGNFSFKSATVLLRGDYVKANSN